MLTQRRKTLSLDDVAICPRYSDIQVGNQLLASDYSSYVGIPIFASSRDATGTFEIAEAMTELNMGSFISTRYQNSELYDFFFEDRSNIIPSFGITESQQHKWNELKGSLPAGKITSVQLVSNTPHNIVYLYEIGKFKENNPDVTIYTSPVSDPYVAARLVEVGADVVLIGDDARSISMNMNTTGVGVGHVTALVECVDAVKSRGGLVMGAGYYDDNSDICKVLALGADFVQLEETLLGHTECFGKTEQTAGEMMKNGVSYRGAVYDTLNDTIVTLKDCMKEVGVDKIKFLKDAEVILI